MNKQTLLAKIIAQLTTELEAFEKSARAAHAEATHEQNKAENKYDTRALEASYLAHGQSRQAAELVQARDEFRTLPVREFAADATIDLGALVELIDLQTGSAPSFYFIGPRAGGMEITQGKKTVLVLTPSSPLGRQLLGKKKGDRLKIELAGGCSDYQIAAVS